MGCKRRIWTHSGLGRAVPDPGSLLGLPSSHAFHADKKPMGPRRHADLKPIVFFWTSPWVLGSLIPWPSGSKSTSRGCMSLLLGSPFWRPTTLVLCTFQNVMSGQVVAIYRRLWKSWDAWSVMLTYMCTRPLHVGWSQGWEGKRDIGQRLEPTHLRPLASGQKAENSGSSKFEYGFPAWHKGVSVNGREGNILYLTIVTLIFNSCIWSYMAHVGLHMYSVPGLASVRGAAVRRVEAECAFGLLCQLQGAQLFLSLLPWGWAGTAFNFHVPRKPSGLSSQQWLLSFTERALKTCGTFWTQSSC